MKTKELDINISYKDLFDSFMNMLIKEKDFKNYIFLKNKIYTLNKEEEEFFITNVVNWLFTNWIFKIQPISNIKINK